MTCEIMPEIRSCDETGGALRCSPQVLGETMQFCKLPESVAE